MTSLAEAAKQLLATRSHCTHNVLTRRLATLNWGGLASSYPLQLFLFWQPILIWRALSIVIQGY